MYEMSASEFGTVGMRRRMRACADEFLATVTEGVVHNVYKAVTRSCFGVTRQNRASVGKWMLRHCVTTSHRHFTQHL